MIKNILYEIITVMANVDDFVLEQVRVGQIVYISAGGKRTEYCLVTDIVTEGETIARWRMRRWFGDDLEKLDSAGEHFRSPWPFDRILLLSMEKPFYYLLPNSRGALAAQGLLKIKQVHLG